MNIVYRIVMVLSICFFAVSVSWSDPVPLPCAPNCTVDPCKLAPERCKDQGGPISDKQEPKSDNATGTSDSEDDPCKWCNPCSKTPGSECLKCCTPGK